ncbi:hypothetical protein FOTG_16256 [Fusarium oxysporum f. sp. vasinfectum 25433]|uniref:Uncharacterized protein n=1 Tax=Fusarium oxysporum f. sp. vasinfectum 25433 TaxID=1089449 RepID=X0KPA9_FUSOX|nr:hypothetical protein FOTG_16256 [Fusarium oxysporum f. sp. vasinfectum 25433]
MGKLKVYDVLESRLSKCRVNVGRTTSCIRSRWAFLYFLVNFADLDDEVPASGAVKKGLIRDWSPDQTGLRQTLDPSSLSPSSTPWLAQWLIMNIFEMIFYCCATSADIPASVVLTK